MSQRNENYFIGLPSGLDLDSVNRWSTFPVSHENAKHFQDAENPKDFHQDIPLVDFDDYWKGLAKLMAALKKVFN